MNKPQRPSQILLAFLCILILWGGLFLTDRIRSLENQVRSLNGSLSSYDTYHQIESLRQSLKQEIEQGASMVASSETLISFEEGTFDVEISIVPKMIATGEDVYLTLGDQRVMATSLDGSSYTASFSLPPSETVPAYLSIESAGGKRQEKLPDVQFRDYLSFAVDSRMEHDSKTLDIRIFALNEESKPIFPDRDTVELVFFDEMKKEMGRMPFREGASGLEYEEGPMFEPGAEVTPYHLVIPDRYYVSTRFSASVVMTIGDVTLHADEVYTYEDTGAVMEGIGGGEFRISFGD